MAKRSDELRQLLEEVSNGKRREGMVKWERLEEIKWALCSYQGFSREKGSTSGLMTCERQRWHRENDTDDVAQIAKKCLSYTSCFIIRPQSHAHLRERTKGESDRELLINCRPST